MKRIIPIVVLIAVIAGLYFWWRRTHNEDPNRILLSGNLELKQYEISFKTAGRLVDLKADEGDDVRKGMLLARIDPEQIVQARDRELASTRVAESQLAQNRAGVEYQRESNAGELALRKAELAQAQAKLNELLAGSRPQEVQQARAAVADAKSWQAQASEDWTRAQQLFKNDDISRSQYDQFRAKYDSTKANLLQAEQKLGMVEEGPRKEDIQAARASVARAEAAVKLADAMRLSLRQKELELDARRADIQRNKMNVAVYQTQIGDTEVTSPADGVVLVRSAEPGEVIAAGTSVLTIGNIEHPWLRGYITEPQLGRVKLGQKVKLTTDSYPGKEYWGRVSFISSQAEFTPKQIQTREERVKLVYRVKVDVENKSRDLKSNMPVDAEIIVE